jgi:hypothetical protein
MISIFYKSLFFLETDNIYNADEQNYFRSYIYYNLAIIYKMKKNKDKSLEMLEFYNKYNKFRIQNIRKSLLKDFPII